jgi:hypothetical protein
MAQQVLGPIVTKRKAQDIKVELFATNLYTPSHMEWTPDGRLLVSEHTAGQIKDITHGGDMRQALPFAHGLRGPSSILPLEDGRILASEMWGGRVIDISSGGDMSKQEPFAKELAAPYSLACQEASIFVTERSGKLSAQVTDITAGGGRNSHRPYVTRIPIVPLLGLEGLAPPEIGQEKWADFSNACADWLTTVGLGDQTWIVVGSSVLGQLVRVPKDGGSYLDLAEQGHLLAKGLNWMGGEIQHPYDHLVYVAQPLKGTIMAIDPTTLQDYRFVPPVVQGLNMPTCVRFSSDGETMFVCSMPTGSIWKITHFA